MPTGKQFVRVLQRACHLAGMTLNDLNKALYPSSSTNYLYQLARKRRFKRLPKKFLRRLAAALDESYVAIVGVFFAARYYPELAVDNLVVPLKFLAGKREV